MTNSGLFRFFVFATLMIIFAIGCEAPATSSPATKTAVLLEQVDQVEQVEPDGAIRCKVVRVIDGDTIACLIEKDGEKKEQVIRLADIDCPELRGSGGQPFSKKAKLFASKLCFGKEVQVVKTGRHYKRWIAYVLLPNGEFLNHELLKAGLAWHATKYSDSKELQALEDEARRKRVGLWRDDSPIKPEDWRDGIRE